MILQVTVTEYLPTNVYFYIDEESKHGFIIDPGAEAAKLQKVAEERGFVIEKILLTHGHFDHIAAVSDLLQEDTKLLVHALDAPLLSDPDRNVSRLFTGKAVTAPPPTGFVKEGDVLALAGLEFTVFHTPGHTPGSVCYRVGDHFFTGDTLFDHGWGRTDLPGGDEHALFASLRRIMPLARTLSVHPGHAS